MENRITSRGDRLVAPDEQTIPFIEGAYRERRLRGVRAGQAGGIGIAPEATPRTVLKRAGQEKSNLRSATLPGKGIVE